MLDLETPANGLVTLRLLPPYAENDEAGYLEALQAISDLPGPFVLLTVFVGGGALSPAGERAQALWFKATRAEMNRRCRALAIVRPGAGARTAETFGKLWSFPVIATEDEAAARAFLLTKLGESP